MSYIYALVDPVTFEIRYVGKTNKSIQERLKEHIQFIKWEKSHKNDWIKSLLRRNLKPITCILEECEDWQSAEKFWIKLCKNIGFNLTNLTEGGDGVVNGSSEIGRKISEKNKGKFGPNKGKKFSKEWREKLSQAKLRTHRTDEVREKLSKANKGRVRSEEFKKKVSQTMKGNYIPWNKGLGNKAREVNPKWYDSMLKQAEKRKGKPKANPFYKGEIVYNAKLTMMDARNIRAIWETTENKRGLARMLAHKYNVHKDTIMNVIRNHTYKEP